RLVPTTNVDLHNGGLVFGGNSSGVPALFASGTTLQARLGNNTADAPFSTSKLLVGNCTSSASPAVCGSAAAGSVVIAAAATTVTVNTTAVTANSQIFLQPDDSL